MKTDQLSTIADLYTAILALKSIDESKKFFRDLLTEEEIKEFANRWQVARLLDENVSYDEITQLTGMSSTTIARISKWLTKGMGGYRLVLDRLYTHHIPSTRSRED